MGDNSSKILKYILSDSRISSFSACNNQAPQEKIAAQKSTTEHYCLQKEIFYQQENVKNRSEW